MSQNNTQVVILVGGKGTRLRPLTNSIPKPMITIGNTPFLELLLLNLKKNGFRKFLLLVGHLSSVVVDHFGNGSKWGLEIKYSFEKELLDTGGGLINSYDLLDDEFILLNGDTYMDLDYNFFLEFAKNKQSIIIVAYDGVRYGDVEYNMLVDEKDLVTKFSQSEVKPEFNAVNSGIYYINRSIFEHMKIEKLSLEIDIIPKLLKQNKVYAYRTKTRFYDIGTFTRLTKFREKIKN